MRGKLPGTVLHRKKTGFDIPTHDWFRGPLRALLTDTLTAEGHRGDWRVRRPAIQSLIRDHLDRRINVGISLMGIDDAVPVDEAMESVGDSARDGAHLKALPLLFTDCRVNRGGGLPGMRCKSAFVDG